MCFLGGWVLLTWALHLASYAPTHVPFLYLFLDLVDLIGGGGSNAEGDESLLDDGLGE